MRAVLDGARSLLLQHTQVQPDTVRVRLLRFAPAGIDVELFACVLTPDFGSFLAIQEELLLSLMDLIESCGTALALPSQTTSVARDTRSGGSRQAAG